MIKNAQETGMRHHPDPAELDSYVLGKSQGIVADAVVEHLLVCEKCIRSVALHREYIEAEKIALKELKGGADAQAIEVAHPGVHAMAVPGGAYAWALLVPLTVAVTVMSNDGSLRVGRPAMMAKSHNIVQVQYSGPSADAYPTDEEQAAMDGDGEAEEPVRIINAAAHYETPPAHRTEVARYEAARYFVPDYQSRQTEIASPVLLQPASYHAPIPPHVRLSRSPALSLVSTEVNLAPPPKRDPKFKRFMAALFAPFRARKDQRS